jgi:hypothetical protein
MTRLERCPARTATNAAGPGATTGRTCVQPSGTTTLRCIGTAALVSGWRVLSSKKGSAATSRGEAESTALSGRPDAPRAPEPDGGGRETPRSAYAPGAGIWAAFWC